MDASRVFGKGKKKLDSINRCTTSIRLGNTCRQFYGKEKKKKKKTDFLIIFIIIIFFIKLYQNFNKMIN